MDRHDLAYLSQSASVHFLDDSLSEYAKHKVLDLLQDNVPLTVCRQDHVGEGHIKLAISCFVSGQKYRVAVAVDQDDILRITRPVALEKLIAKFSLLADPMIQQFVHQMHILECNVCVYGSYAYEYLTSQKYTNDQSDLDLVLYPHSRNHLNTILKQLQTLKSQTNLKIDGDIKINDDWHVSFNELIQISPDLEKKIIAKGIKRIGLFTLKELLG